MNMGGDRLASFFLRVQAVEESFLQLEGKERSRALNILQSSVNKLLNFVGDADIVSASLSVSVPDSFLSNLENKVKDPQSSCTQVSAVATNQVNKSVLSGPRKRKVTNRVKKTNNKCQKRSAFKFNNGIGLESSEANCSFPADAANAQNAGSSMHRPTAGKGKQESKDNFEDDFQELADFDYDFKFNPSLQSTNTGGVSRAGNGHMTQCGSKLTGKMLSISAATDGGACPVSGAATVYPDQVLDVSASHDGGSRHFASQLLSGGSGADMKGGCHLPQPPQYGAQIMASCSQMEAAGDASQFATGVVVDAGADPSQQYAARVMDGGGGNPSQFAGGVIDSNGDPSQYAGGVMDSGGNPSQFAGGVIDSSGDPSQYANTVIDSSGETSQYPTGSVMDSTGEGSQYAAGVMDMSEGQEAGLCSGSHVVHAELTGAMIPTAQDVTVCTTTAQYPGPLPAMSLPDGLSYSAAHYSHTIMQGLNCPPAPHPHFNNAAVLDMSTGRQSELGIPAAHTLPSAQYAGTIFEGAAVIGAQAGSVCSPFQFRRPMLEPHEAFHRSQELSLMHASMLQQQQLYQLQQQALVSRWRVFVCKECGEVLTHHRSVRPHLLTHGYSPLTCRFCRQRQVNEVALRHHLCGGQLWRQSANVSREMFMCGECGKFFASRGRLKSHATGEHGRLELPKDVKYTCRFCGLQLPRRSAMCCHYRQHAGGRFVCRQCGAIHNDFVQHSAHMAAHARRRKALTCQHCGQVFGGRLRLARHLQAHSAVCACDKCQRTFSSQTSLFRHQYKVHRMKTRARVVKSQSHRGYHNKQLTGGKDLSEAHSHGPADEKLLDCTTCRMRFDSRRALGKHRRTLGHCQRSGKAREAQHLCSECGKAYFRRQALQRHQRQHQSSKPFSCTYCQFRCGSRDNLRRHQAQHFSTLRNFICELCGAAFHAKKTLEMHHSYKHSSERRFKCPECPMTFKAGNALSRHAKTHSRSREHGCWCGAAFNRLYNLRRHMRLVHGSDDALPPLRKVEVLDQNSSVKQAITAPPAKKMLVKSRKVKADCMQKEQEAAAAAVVVVVGGEEEEEKRGVGGGGAGGGGGGSGEGGEVEREGGEGVVGVLPPQVGMGGGVLPQNQPLGLPNVNNYSAMSAAATVGVGGGGGGGGVMAPVSGVLPHPFSHHHPHPLTMEQSYAMVSATLHHHHHHHHNLHHPHDPQHALLTGVGVGVGVGGGGGGGEPVPSLPFPHLSHPSLDYSQLSAVLPYPTNIGANTAAANATTTAANTTTTTVTNGSTPPPPPPQPPQQQQQQQQQQQRQDYSSYPVGVGGGGGMEGGGGGGQVGGDYTTSPFSFIQNFLLPSVGVANHLLDLAHASGAK